MEIKDRFTLKIESVAFGGHGVGRVDGFVVFVPFTAPGERVEVEITGRKKKFARARLMKILEPSEIRVSPLCRYYGKCGGCCYQHIGYEHQLKIKKKQVEEAFLKIGGIARPPVGDVIGSPKAYAYRGKAQLHFAKSAGDLSLGFMDVSGGRLVDIDRCEIMDETINDQIRQARAKGSPPLAGEDLTFWSGPQDIADEAIVRVVKGRDFLVPRTGFFQANLYLLDQMVEEVCSQIDQKKIETAIDACCGSGLFSIMSAPYVRQMTGIEIYEKSVKYARLNAERLGVQNAAFICGDIEDILKGEVLRAETCDLLILDPPRTGLSSKTQAAIESLKIKEIIYVSCNPATQARDVRALCEAGYDLQSLQPLDMFPQTEHIEVIGLLSRR